MKNSKIIKMGQEITERTKAYDLHAGTSVLIPGNTCAAEGNSENWE